MPQFVYLIEARGLDGLNGNQMVTIRNSVVFRTQEAADKRHERFKQACLTDYRLSEHPNVPIKVESFPLEIIEE